MSERNNTGEYTEADHQAVIALQAAAPEPRVIGEVGTCDLCGQTMNLTDDDCWHPYNVERACPPEPSSGDLDGLQRFYGSGLRPLRPGREHFVSADPPRFVRSAS